MSNECGECGKKLEQKPERYTYADYAKWDTDKRYELIHGVPYAMAGPSSAHQRLSSRLIGQLYVFLQRRPCEVFSAPFDVRLNADESDDIVVQPDISVICDKSKIDDRGCIGAPDMIIEILSPGTSKRDTITKFNLYRQFPTSPAPPSAPNTA
jgi:Uma2 family endonuclease